MDSESISRLIQEEVDRALSPLIHRLRDVEAQCSAMTAKMANAAIGKDEPLNIVPLPDGSIPQVEIPLSIAHLVASENEFLPNGQRNNWNRMKSLALLRAYDPTYETDEKTNTENENEGSQSSRNLRLRVAKVLGVTRLQLNMALMIV